MSAKGRKGKQVEEGEFYPTPRECIYALLEHPKIHLPGGVWIEPCAGTGRIIGAVNEVRSDVRWLACELNPSLGPLLERELGPEDILLPFGDFVHRPWNHPKADVLIMNPPFSLTMQFVQAGLERARHVVCLQRQAWFGSVGRTPWLEKHCPDSNQLGWRPSFRPDGSTDNCDYTWYHWPEGSLEGREEGAIRILPRVNRRQMQLF